MRKFFRSLLVEEEGAAVKAAGMNYVHLPFNIQNPDPKLIDNFIGILPMSLREISITHQIRTLAQLDGGPPVIVTPVIALLAIGTLWSVIGLVRITKALTPALQQLSTVTQILEQNRDNLGRTVANLAPFVRVFTNTLGNGRWFDSYVENLIPGVLGSAICGTASSTPLPAGCTTSGGNG